MTEKSKTRLSHLAQDSYPITVERLNGIISKINELEERVEQLEKEKIYPMEL